MFYSRPHRYKSLEHTSPGPSITLSQIISCALFLGISVTTFIVGWYFGQLGEVWPGRDIPLKILPQVLVYNRTFSEDPALRAHEPDIWDTMFPANGGYFAHPTIAPRRSTVSAYHQLHCLHAVRDAYYNAIHASEAGHAAITDDMPAHIAPRHIRHCLDLIRQSLMCHADTTVEVKDHDTGGVRGFGIQHQCRDWFGLVKWTEDMQKRYGMKDEPFEDSIFN